jgi:putative peptidoglycan lipid II flippase
LGLGVLQLTVIINTRFASYLDEGANSWIFWADRILEFPLSLFAVSMGTALLPTLSEFWSKGQLDKMVALMNRSLRYVFYISIPAGVGIYFLAHEIISVIFKRGQFSELDVANTGLVLGVYGAAIFAYAGLRVLQPAFYAAQNTWLPALISCLMLVVHYFLAQEMMARYELFGLAASSTVSASLNLFILLCCFRFMVGRIGGMVMLSSLSKIIAGSLVMGVWLKFVKQFWVSDSILGGIAFLVIAISGAVFVYLITTYVLRSPEFVQVKEKIQARLNRKALAK